MSLNYTITNRRTPQSEALPDINEALGKSGWVTALNKEYGMASGIHVQQKIADEENIDSHLTGVEKYAYEHDIAEYSWKNGKYTPGDINPAPGNYAKPSADPETQRMYQQAMAASNSTATQGSSRGQQASQSVFDTSTSRYAPAHQNIINF